VRQYVKKSELSKIDLESTRNKLLQKKYLHEKLYNDFQPRFKNERYDGRAKRVVDGLGLPERRKEAHSSEDLYEAYVGLVRHKGLSRKKCYVQCCEYL